MTAPDTNQPLVAESVTPDTSTAVTAPEQNATSMGGTNGIIDLTPTLELPTYHWAGTSIGNQNVMECETCGSMVRADNTDKHTLMHRMLNAVCNYTGVQW